MEYLRKIYPFWLYQPNKKQLLFHQLVFNKPKADVVLFVGANQSGKTTANIINLLIFFSNVLPLSLQGLIELPNLPEGASGRVIATDFLKGIGKVYAPKLFDIMPNEFLDGTPKKNPLGIISEMKSKRKITVDFMSFEQPCSMFEGWTGYFVGCDELIPRDRYVSTRRGLMAKQGIMYMTFTPPSGMDEERKKEFEWIYDELYLKAKGGSDKIKCVEVDIYDNIKYLSESAIASFEQSLSAEEKEARIFGRWTFQMGLVFKEFDPSIHIIEPFEINKNYPIYIATDPHSTAPTATIFAAIDRENNVYIFDELYVPSVIIPEYVHKIKDRLVGLNLRTALMDASAQERNPVTNVSYLDEYRKSGIFYITAKKDRLDVGYSKIKEYLKNKKLFIFNTCKNTIYELSHFTPSSEKDHLISCLRYLLLFNPTYKDIVEESLRRREEQKVMYKSCEY